MAESAPSALVWLGSRTKPDLGGILSGIIGDRAHDRGYHRGRNYVSSGDYSAFLTEDKAGSGEYACAIDMSFSASKMKLYTGRLKAAAERNDPRMRYVREFYGTLNGTDVYGLIHEGSSDRTWRRSTSDKSHLWHVHISILRKYANDKSVMQGILDVLMGKAYATPIEEFVMATKDEVKAALREVITESATWSTPAGARMAAAGWNPQSVRGMLEYLFEFSRDEGERSKALATAVAGVDDSVVKKLTAQSPEDTAALLKAVLGDQAEAVFRAGLGQVV